MKNSKYFAIRTTIKNLSELQKQTKNQRKTINLSGEREMEPEDAVSAHNYNRYELRHLYMVYQTIKGKEVQYPKDGQYSQSKIDKLVEIYTPKVEMSA